MRTWRGRVIDWIIMPLWPIMPSKLKAWAFLNDDIPDVSVDDRELLLPEED